MGCRFEWADDSHLIMNVYLEVPWTWAEYDAMSEPLFETIRAAGHPCATTVDVSKMGSIPRGNVMGSLSRMEKMMPSNVFASAVVAAPYPAMVFLDILFRIRPNARRLALFTRTMPEAHEKIKEIYQKQVLSQNDKQS